MKKGGNGRKQALVVILFILVVGLIITGTTLIKSILSLGDDSAISIAISSIESVGLLFSIIVAIKQLADSKEIARATFIMELNKTFVENPDYVNLYNLLQNCLDDTCPCERGCGDKYNLEKECNIDIPKGLISNYLTFFETVYLLKKRDVIDFNVLDDLFAYRFFLAVHSKVVQQKKIKNQPQNFKNIFCLECEWLSWREAHGKATDPNVPSVYNRRLLKDLVDDKTYEILTEDCDREDYKRYSKTVKKFKSAKTNK